MAVQMPPNELATEWLAAVSQLWSLEIVPGSLSPVERERAVQLRNTKYSEPGWTHRR